MTIRIKNWARFQHFKDRSPPWIKLYRDLLDDIQWHKLDPVAAKALVMIWLIASEEDGNLPDTEVLAFRMRKSEAEVQDILSALSHWLEHDDDDVISTRYHADTAGGDAPIPLARSRETEGETEKEGEKKPRVRAASTPSIDGVPDNLLADYMAVRKAKKAGPLSDTAIAGLRREAEKAGITLAQAITACVEFGWQGFNAGWYAERTKGAAPAGGQSAGDPDSRSAIEAEGVAKGIGAWNELDEQWHVYKARVRGIQPSLGLDQLAAMAARRAH